MLVQLYRLPMNQDTMANAQPGQFVMPGNGSDTVCGFISVKDVEAEQLEFCVFDPTELPTGGIPLKESMTMDECMDLLEAALELNPEMKLAWSELL